MKECQININNLSKGRTFPYFIEYVDDVFYQKDEFSYEFYDDEVVFLHKNFHNIHRYINMWDDSIGYRKLFIPENVNISSINLYFPDYSLDKYERGVKYCVSICTYIYGKKIYLGCYLVDRSMAIANNIVKKYKNTRYYEYINLPFIDPWYIVYGDEWGEWRRVICGEPAGVNATGSLITVEIQPLEIYEDSYIQMNDYKGGYNSLWLSEDDSDFLHADLKLDGSSLVLKCIFNEVFNNNIINYLRETYCIECDNIRYELLVKDGDNIYKFWEFNGLMDSLNISDIRTGELGFKDWNEWSEGMVLMGSINIMCDDIDVITLYTNEIPVTMEVFKYMVNQYFPININLDFVDMYNYKLNVVNKVEKKIINIDRPEDYKSNILKPIFIQSHPIGNVIFHPQVTENICLDLNGYKNYVETFYLKLEGIEFVEVGRVSSGVVFNVVGSKLPNETLSGTFYILNENSEMVTTGKYSYIN